MLAIGWIITEHQRWYLRFCLEPLGFREYHFNDLVAVKQKLTSELLLGPIDESDYVVCGRSHVRDTVRRHVVHLLCPITRISPAITSCFSRFRLEPFENYRDICVQNILCEADRSLFRWQQFGRRFAGRTPVANEGRVYD